MDSGIRRNDVKGANTYIQTFPGQQWAKAGMTNEKLLFEMPSGVEQLARIEDAVRVKHALDAAHQVDLGGRTCLVQIRLL